MSTEDTSQNNAEHQPDSDSDPERAGQLADKPEPDESAKDKAKEMTKAYDDELKTAVLPGSDGTVTGTAVNEWLDDDGNPKFGQDEGQRGSDGEKAESTPDSEG
ncbi:MAG: hypothetical protein QOE41_1399 [Mycobacterium sp.]|nr:hypothetical protein [Mycobacterium sp.]MDT5132088.1 hypothetical protein [Mycobacterium sp.]